MSTRKNQKESKKMSIDREEKRLTTVDLEKLNTMVSNRGSNPIEKAFYDLFLKPLEQRIESKKYIQYLERINRRSYYLATIKTFYQYAIKGLEGLKQREPSSYNRLAQKYGPLDKENIWDWYYDWYIEDNPAPEISSFWYEGSYDEAFMNLIKDKSNFTAGEIETIEILVTLFWNRIDRLEDNEKFQKSLVEQLKGEQEDVNR